MNPVTTFYRSLGNAGELGFHIESSKPLSFGDLDKIWTLISEPWRPKDTTPLPHFPDECVVEIGPRFSSESPESSNAVGICHIMGIPHITRFEQTMRHLIIGETDEKAIMAKHLDRMTQERYPAGFKSFAVTAEREPVFKIDIIQGGMPALVEACKGLGVDKVGLEFIFNLFVKTLERNPNSIELPLIGNAISDHCRHIFWTANIVIDGVKMPKTLMQLCKEPLKRLGANSRTLLAFRDGSGVQRGFEVPFLLPNHPGRPSVYDYQSLLVHLTATGETHCHPTTISAFEGAITGTLGRQRDGQSTGKGSILGAGAAGYCVGNLFIPGFEIPGEVVGRDKKSKYESSLNIVVKGSNGVSAGQNERGEPTIHGIFRTYEQRVAGEWIGFRKCVLWSAGTGYILDGHVEKGELKPGMLLIRLGGLARPIGTNGGGASSMVQGENSEKLDYDSVQRGDAEEANRHDRVIRACVEMLEKNIIVFIQDMGAGGITNAAIETMGAYGGVLHYNRVNLGDKNMSNRQIGSSETQQSYIIAIKPEDLVTLEVISKRERANLEVLGEITGDGRMVVYDVETDSKKIVDLPVTNVLEDQPQRTFEFERRKINLPPLEIPTNLTLAKAIEDVFRIPSVGSKSHLVDKGDRSVGGRVIQQQSCGIAQINIADSGVITPSFRSRSGTVVSIGENPNRILIDPVAGTRMVVGEMLTNMACVGIGDMNTVSYRSNTMAPAKLPYQGPIMYDVVKTMSETVIELGFSSDGGKDSSSLAAEVCGELVKSPTCLVMYGYAPVPDFHLRVTPDVKRPGESTLFLIDPSRGKTRLGGSAFAQSLNQLGDECPDMDDRADFKKHFLEVQRRVKGMKILAMHDKTGDGGLITAVAEMCMASHCGFSLVVSTRGKQFAELFNEELGWVVEVSNDEAVQFEERCKEVDICCRRIGVTYKDTLCEIITKDFESLFLTSIQKLRTWWEAVSTALKKQQRNPECVSHEYLRYSDVLPGIIDPPSYRVTFDPVPTDFEGIAKNPPINVAVIREEGSNGDTEMIAAFKEAGFRVTGICMQDLIDRTVYLEEFQGIALVGGFSYKDVCGAGRGWAASIRHNPRLSKMFNDFRNRQDTFGLFVCNGFQVMAELGWAPFANNLNRSELPYLVQNRSGQFESRQSNVLVDENPSFFFSEMVGCRLPVWIAHGEGRIYSCNESIIRAMLDTKLVPLKFIDPWGNPTNDYPYNPNGSPSGATSWCTEDGRFTGLMPHIERGFLLQQWAWMPEAMRKTLKASPWLFAFQSAYKRALELRKLMEK